MTVRNLNLTCHKNVNRGGGRCSEEVARRINLFVHGVGKSCLLGLTPHFRQRPSLRSPSDVRRPFATNIMVSLHRYIRSIRRVGLKEWWHQLQYIGDAKSGAFKGKDQYAATSRLETAGLTTLQVRQPLL